MLKQKLRLSPVCSDVFSKDDDDMNLATSGVLERHKQAATNKLCLAGIPKNSPQTTPQSTTVIMMAVLPKTATFHTCKIERIYSR